MTEWLSKTVLDVESTVAPEDQHQHQHASSNPVDQEGIKNDISIAFYLITGFGSWIVTIVVSLVTKVLYGGLTFLLWQLQLQLGLSLLHRISVSPRRAKNGLLNRWLPFLLKMDDRGVELWTLGILLVLKIPELPLIDSMDKCGDCIVPLVYLFLLYLIAKTALIIWIMSKRTFLILNQFKGRLSYQGRDEPEEEQGGTQHAEDGSSRKKQLQLLKNTFHHAPGSEIMEIAFFAF